MITAARQQKIKNLVHSRQQGIVVLEDISDPHNAAAVLRSCDAFGFHTVYFIFDKARRFSPRSHGKLSSASANKWLDFKTFSSTEECLQSLHEQQYEVVATALTEKAENFFTAEFTKPKLALMFGNEHAGLSETALRLADRTMIIPMRGMVQSLNLSVTAGIVLAEVARQRLVAHSVSGAEYQLTSEQQDQILSQYLH